MWRYFGMQNVENQTENLVISSTEDIYIYIYIIIIIINLDFRWNNVYWLKISCLIIHMLTSILNSDFLNSLFDAVNLSLELYLHLSVNKLSIFHIKNLLLFSLKFSPKFWDQIKLSVPNFFGEIYGSIVSNNFWLHMLSCFWLSMSKQFLSLLEISTCHWIPYENSNFALK